MRKALLVLIPATALVALGCSSTESTAHTRAANDFSCAKELVVVKNIGGTSYRASGCGQTATYDCVEAASHGFLFFRRHSYLCVPEGQTVAAAYQTLAPKTIQVQIAPGASQSTPDARRVEAAPKTQAQDTAPLNDESDASQ